MSEQKRKNRANLLTTSEKLQRKTHVKRTCLKALVQVSSFPNCNLIEAPPILSLLILRKKWENRTNARSRIVSPTMEGSLYTEQTKMRISGSVKKLTYEVVWLWFDHFLHLVLHFCFLRFRLIVSNNPGNRPLHCQTFLNGEVSQVPNSNCCTFCFKNGDVSANRSVSQRKGEADEYRIRVIAPKDEERESKKSL